jgi:hypothetical protein
VRHRVTCGRLVVGVSGQRARPASFSPRRRGGRHLFASRGSWSCCLWGARGHGVVRVESRGPGVSEPRGVPGQRGAAGPGAGAAARGRAAVRLRAHRQRARLRHHHLSRRGRDSESSNGPFRRQASTRSLTVCSWCTGVPAYTAPLPRCRTASSVHFSSLTQPLGP